MRSICRAAQVRRAWRDASSDLAASAIWWKQCVISWPSTAVPMAKYGSASTAAGADWSARAVGAATSAQRRKEQEAHGQAQGTVTAMLAAADAGGRLLSDPRRLFRGMTLAMRTGLDVVRPVSLSRSPSLPPSLPAALSLAHARSLVFPTVFSLAFSLFCSISLSGSLHTCSGHPSAARRCENSKTCGSWQIFISRAKSSTPAAPQDQ